MVMVVSDDVKWCVIVVCGGCFAEFENCGNC